MTAFLFLFVQFSSKQPVKFHIEDDLALALRESQAEETERRRRQEQEQADLELAIALSKQEMGSSEA